MGLALPSEILSCVVTTSHLEQTRSPLVFCSLFSPIRVWCFHLEK